jgi:hypothetical protein
VKNFKGMIKLMAKKIFTYVSCLTCDSQNFKNYRGLQNHMMDKGHSSVNEEDLEEFFYKFYDKKSLLSVKDRGLRKTNEFQILKIKLKMKKVRKVKKTDDEGWSTVSEGEEDSKMSVENTNETLVDTNVKNSGVSRVDPSNSTKVKTLKKKDVEEVNQSESDSEDEYEPITLPNGELLLENGTILGNKIYQVYYKQRFRINKYDKLVDKVKLERRKKLKKISKALRSNQVKIKYFSVKDSNKSSFERVNTLFKACKQVNV